jgi:hypothetical protein
MSILLTPTSSHKPFVGPKSQHNTTPQPISPHHTLIYIPLCTISIQPSLPSLYLLIIVPTLISITRYATPFHLHIINDKISHLICPLGLPLPPPIPIHHYAHSNIPYKLHITLMVPSFSVQEGHNNIIGFGV